MFISSSEDQLNGWLDGCDDERGLLTDGYLDALTARRWDATIHGGSQTHGAILSIPDKHRLRDGWALGWDEGIELGQSGIEGFDSSLLNCINGTQLGRPLR